ncbi:MAG: threonylcarbamoyl-AMP synthase [Nitrospirae bacterium]|nr:threonylcarbamoyl-AMP synthase [Nitrospirota bacterium]
MIYFNLNEAFVEDKSLNGIDRVRDRGNDRGIDLCDHRLRHEDRVLEVAVRTLREGGLVAFPTETFYGLGVRYDDHDALSRLYELKRRPAGSPFPLILGRQSGLYALTDDVGPGLCELIAKHWPGPLTILFKARLGLPAYILSEEGKIAVRVPGESFALRLAKVADFAITATSANPSGLPPANSAPMVLEYFDGLIDCVVDGGETTVREPSTIVDVVEGKVVVIRQGRVKL